MFLKVVKFLRIVCTMVWAVFVTASFVQAQTNLINNGSFEENDRFGMAWLTKELPSNDGFLTGWPVTGTIDYIGCGVQVSPGDPFNIGCYWPAADGNRSIDLNGSSPGSISQTFPTTPGTLYVVRFAMAGNPTTGSFDPCPIKELRVAAANDFADFAFDITGWTLQNMGWEEQAWIFTATSSMTTLTFSSLTKREVAGRFCTMGLGPAIDNIRVEELAGPASAAGLTLRIPEDALNESLKALIDARALDYRKVENIKLFGRDFGDTDFLWQTDEAHIDLVDTHHVRLAVKANIRVASRVDLSFLGRFDVICSARGEVTLEGSFRTRKIGNGYELVFAGENEGTGSLNAVDCSTDLFGLLANYLRDTGEDRINKLLRESLTDYTYLLPNIPAQQFVVSTPQLQVKDHEVLISLQQKNTLPNLALVSLDASRPSNQLGTFIFRATIRNSATRVDADGNPKAQFRFKVRLFDGNPDADADHQIDSPLPPGVVEIAEPYVIETLEAEGTVVATFTGFLSGAIFHSVYAVVDGANEVHELDKSDNFRVKEVSLLIASARTPNRLFLGTSSTQIDFTPQGITPDYVVRVYLENGTRQRVLYEANITSPGPQTLRFSTSVPPDWPPLGNEIVLAVEKPGVLPPETYRFPVTLVFPFILDVSRLDDPTQLLP